MLRLAPVIISAPENSYGPLGANLTLDCEARGFPAPTITWQFVSTEGKTISLPSKYTATIQKCSKKLHCQLIKSDLL